MKKLELLLFSFWLFSFDENVAYDIVCMSDNNIWSLLLADMHMGSI